MARPKKDPNKADPTPLNPLEGYEPCGTRGPTTVLEKKPKMIGAIAKALASGKTRKDAASKAGTTAACLRQWLKRGEEHALQGKATLYTKLLAEVQHAEAHYREKLQEVEHRALTNPKGYDSKLLRWRMAVSDPENYTQQRGGGDDAGTGALAAFALMTPEEAVRSVQEKALRFLEEEDKRKEQEAAEAVAPVDGAPPAASGEGGAHGHP